MTALQQITQSSTVLNAIEIDTLLATWLRGERPPLAREVLEGSRDALLDRIDYHGVAGLLNAELANSDALPDVLRQCLEEQAVAEAFWEEKHARLLRCVLASLHDHGIAPILFKGTAIAYSHYTDSAHRGRSDTDMLVAVGDFGRAANLLIEKGFSTPLIAGGVVIQGQKTFTLTDSARGFHTIDLHRKLCNSSVLAPLFTYEDLYRRSQALSKLARGARAVGAVDLLLITCVHRIFHSYSTADRLIWLHDIHLLATRFSTGEWDAFLHRAHEKGLSEICAEGLRLAQTTLGTRLPDKVLPELATWEAREKPAVYLASTPLARLTMDFRAEPGLARKARFLRELAFPPADYMRVRFSHLRPAWLPWLYVARAAGGLWKLRHSREGAK